MYWNDNLNVSHTPSLFYFTGFYGNPNHILRFNSWLLLNKIASTHFNSLLGWLVGGDFTEMLYDKDKRGGAPRNFGLSNAFRSALSHNGLISLKVAGPFFTWDNKREGHNQILERLDHFVANDTW